MARQFGWWCGVVLVNNPISFFDDLLGMPSCRSFSPTDIACGRGSTVRCGLPLRVCPQENPGLIRREHKSVPNRRNQVQIAPRPMSDAVRGGQVFGRHQKGWDDPYRVRVQGGGPRRPREGKGGGREGRERGPSGYQGGHPTRTRKRAIARILQNTPGPRVTFGRCDRRG